MDNNKILELYSIDKMGLISSDKKKCLCGNEMDINENECNKCGNKLPKSKLLNINKNNHLGKRHIGDKKENYYKFEEKFLLSKGFELYENTSCLFEIFLTPIVTRISSNNGYSINVKISNSKQFKIMSKTENFKTFMNENFKGFIDFCEKCLSQMEFEYAKRNFESLSESEICNFLNVWVNYKALIPYLLGYKIFYYGNKINLKKYYPEVDFNNEKELLKTNLCYELLKTWDIKNEKYIETIIQLSNNPDICLELLKIYRSFNINNLNLTLDTFGILYNKEIEPEDFIRLYKKDSDSFLNLIDYLRFHKKIKGKVNFKEIQDFDDFKLLKTKFYLNKQLKMSKTDIEKLYQDLKIDPLKMFFDIEIPENRY